MAQTVVAVFPEHRDAVEGVEHLRASGFRPDQISILAPDPREVEGFADEIGVSVVRGGVAGSAAGAILGGLTGWLAMVTGLVVPGAGLVVVAGPVAGALLGIIGGVSVGGFFGILAGLGLPKRAAEEYSRELQQGRTLVFVHPEGDLAAVAAAEAALTRAHPLGMHHYEEPVTPPARDA